MSHFFNQTRIENIQYMSQFDVTEDNTKHDLEISEWVLLECY